MLCFDYVIWNWSLRLWTCCPLCTTCLPWVSGLWKPLSSILLTPLSLNGSISAIWKTKDLLFRILSPDSYPNGLCLNITSTTEIRLRKNGRLWERYITPLTAGPRAVKLLFSFSEFNFVCDNLIIFFTKSYDICSFYYSIFYFLCELDNIRAESTRPSKSRWPPPQQNTLGAETPESC